MKKISPSKLELISKCPASSRLSEPFPFVGNVYSERGKNLHAMVAKMWQETKSDLDDFNELDTKDQKAIMLCLEVAKKYQPAGKHGMYVEHKMDLSFLGMGFGGTADLVYYDHASGTVCVIDWKFGSTITDNMKQLICYGLGMKEELDEPVDQLYLVACQPKETVTDSLTTLLVPKSEFNQWEFDIRKWVDLASNKKSKALAGPWCTKNFCECTKHDGACPDYEEMKGEKLEKKETQHKAEVSDAVSGFNPIVVTSELPSLPLVVLDQRTVAKAEDLKARIQALQVVDQASADAMGLLLNESTTFERLVDENKGLVKRPFLDINKAIEEAAKKALIPLGESKIEGKTRLNKWKADEDEKRRAIEREFQKKKQEAEEAERKAREEGLAAARRAQAATTKEARDKALEEAKQAALKRLAAEQASQVAMPIIQAPKPIAGTKTNRVPKYTVKDFAAMPNDYKLENEKMLLTAIKTNKWGDGKEAPAWLEVKWEDEIASSGRKK